MVQAADPTQYGLPAGAVEVLTRRVRHAKHFALGGRNYAGVFAANLHYRLGTEWDDTDDQLADDPQTPGDKLAGRMQQQVRVSGNRIGIADRDSGTGIAFQFPAALNVVGNTATGTLGPLTWVYTANPGGLKLAATVASRLGPRTLRFPYLLLGSASPLVLTNGALVSDAFTIPAPFVTGADRIRYPIVSWSVDASRITLNYDDTAVPNAAFPLVIDPTTTFDEAADSDDGYAEGIGAGYPPAASGSADTSDDVIVQRSLIGGNYFVRVGLTKWDTSSLTSAVTITAASAQLWCISKNNGADALSLVAEYYASSNWPIDSTDYTATPASGAHSGTTIAAITTGAANTFTLSSPDANISKTGSTGLRWHLTAATPTADNNADFGSFIETATHRPKLSVTYSVPGPPQLQMDPAQMAYNSVLARY